MAHHYSVKKVLYKTDGKCAICGTNKNLTSDHIIPFCIVKKNSNFNIVPLCKQCNQLKANRIYPVSAYKYLIEEEKDFLERYYYNNRKTINDYTNKYLQKKYNNEP